MSSRTGGGSEGLYDLIIESATMERMKSSDNNCYHKKENRITSTCFSLKATC